MGPVHSPAAVTIPFKNTAKQKETRTGKTKTKQNEKHQKSKHHFFRPTPSWLSPGRYTRSIAAKNQKSKHQTTKEESDRRSSSVTLEGKGVIALYQPSIGMEKTKKRRTKTQITQCHTVV